MIRRFHELAALDTCFFVVWCVLIIRVEQIFYVVVHDFNFWTCGRTGQATALVLKRNFDRVMHDKHLLMSIKALVTFWSVFALVWTNVAPMLSAYSRARSMGTSCKWQWSELLDIPLDKGHSVLDVTQTLSSSRSLLFAAITIIIFAGPLLRNSLICCMGWWFKVFFLGVVSWTMHSRG